MNGAEKRKRVEQSKLRRTHKSVEKKGQLPSNTTERRGHCLIEKNERERETS